MRAVAVVRGSPSASAQITRIAIEPGGQTRVPSGGVAIHFACNANGKPDSLRVIIEPGAKVNVGVAAGDEVIGRKLRLFGRDAERITQVELATQDEKSIRVLTEQLADSSQGNYRVSATVELDAGTVMAGVVARYQEGQGCYLFSIDWQSRKARLERWVGRDHMIIREVAVPWLAAKHTLSLQVDGFRLGAFVDDELVLQTLDGALAKGTAGVAYGGTRPKIVDVQIHKVAKALGSAVLVQKGRVARLHASMPVAPGHWHVLELSLDWPHPFVPRTVAGFEPALMRQVAAPRVLWSDWRSNLGKNAIGEVGVGGLLTSELSLPNLITLCNQTALVRSVVVSPDGGAVVAITPSVAVTF